MLEELNIPDSLPNIAGYYDKAVKAFFKDPTKKWTFGEIDKLSEIMGKYAARNKREYSNHYAHSYVLDVPAVGSITRDIEVHGLPRNVCLLKWLSIDGLASKVPGLISEISRTFL